MSERRSGLHAYYDAENRGLVRKAATRYFAPRNPEKVVKRHERLGTQYIGKLVMGTVGRVTRQYSGGNYRLNARSKGKLGAAANFAFRGSVINEVIHTVPVVTNAIDIAQDMADQGFDDHVSAGALAFNFGLVALQRYNRARALGMVDRRLQAGDAFNEDYKSWTMIDARTQDHLQSVGQ